MKRNKRNHKVGQRTSKSNFNSRRVANGIKGLYISYNQEDDSKIDDVSLIITSWGSNGGKKDKTPNEFFLSIEMSEYEAILKHLEGETIEDIAYPAKDEEDNKIFLFAKDDSRDDKGLLETSYIMPQSDFYGCTINGRKLAKVSDLDKKRKTELQIFTGVKFNFHNMAYESKNNNNEVYIYNERITKKGIRCIFCLDANGNIEDKQAAYITYHLQFTDEVNEATGKFYENQTIEDALIPYNKEEIEYLIDECLDDDGNAYTEATAKQDATVWKYDEKVYLMPASLIELYKEEGIEHYPTLTNAIDDGVFKELPNGADTLEGGESSTPAQERNFEEELDEADTIEEARTIAVESGKMTTEEANSFTKLSKLIKAWNKK